MVIRILLLVYLSCITCRCTNGRIDRMSQDSGEIGRAVKVSSAYRRVQDARPVLFCSAVADSPLNTNTQWLPYLSPVPKFMQELGHLVLVTAQYDATFQVGSSSIGSSNSSFSAARLAIGELYNDTKRALYLINRNTEIVYLGIDKLHRYTKQAMRILASTNHRARGILLPVPVENIDRVTSEVVESLVPLGDVFANTERLLGQLDKALIIALDHSRTALADSNGTKADQLKAVKALQRTRSNQFEDHKDDFMKLNTFLRFLVAQGFQTRMSARDFTRIASSNSVMRAVLLDDAFARLMTSSVQLRNLCGIYMEVFERYILQIARIIDRRESTPTSGIDNRLRELIEAHEGFRVDIPQIIENKRIALKDALAGLSVA